jgi:Zn-dependent protease
MPVNDLLLTLFPFVVIIFSAIIHEYMHGWMADRLGDPTAKHAGRLTLNPLAHIDLFGSIILPLILIFSSNGGFFFGYAKPVPYNPYNLRDKKYGPAKVAVAGPLANLITAVFFGILIRILALNPGIIPSSPTIIQLLAVVVYINLLLMIFNLIPIPPLDGSKVISPLLPYSWQMRMAAMESYGIIIVLVFVMLGFQFIVPVVQIFFKILTGMSFM